MTSDRDISHEEITTEECKNSDNTSHELMELFNVVRRMLAGERLRLAVLGALRKSKRLARQGKESVRVLYVVDSF